MDKTSIFKVKAEKKHGETYDYSLVEYIDVSAKIKIICRIHGVFEQCPNSHLNGRGCGICGRIRRTLARTTSQEDFLEECRKVHGDTYDYSQVVYKNSQSKIVIICRIHGPFEQVARNHKIGIKCAKCAKEISARKISLTREAFISRAKQAHNDKYDYSLVVYKNTDTKVQIICPIHGPFDQLAGSHLDGKGCNKCGCIERGACTGFGGGRITQEEFIRRAVEKHGEMYDYSLAIYVNAKVKVKIICSIHGLFQQSADSHTNGCGCPLCFGHNPINKAEFLKKAIEKFGNKYDYSFIEYINFQTKVSILCPKHGSFEQAPVVHLNLSYGCPNCASIKSGESKRKTTEEFVLKAIRIHGEMYDYSRVEYIKSNTKVEIICKIHGSFFQKPNNHLNCGGCPKCNITCRASKKSIQYINFLMVEIPELQHFYSSEGEHTILNSKFKADGYDKSKNTIYEFHGDYWHGNPHIYTQCQWNEVCKKTMGELYEKTKHKEEHCIEMGYKYFCVWERDWNNGIKAIIKIQRHFLGLTYRAE